MQIIWSVIPEPERSRDYGDTHQAAVNGRILAQIRDGGWTSSIQYLDPATGKIIEHSYHPKAITIVELKKKVEAKLLDDPAAQAIARGEDPSRRARYAANIRKAISDAVKAIHRRKPHTDPDLYRKPKDKA